MKYNTKVLSKDIIFFFTVLICVIILIEISSTVMAMQMVIPFWIKNNAKWWYQGEIGNSDFIKGIQYLVQNNIIIVQHESSTNPNGNAIPIWVKNNAGWWANGTISDNEFVSGIQYLINSGIIQASFVQNSTNNLESQCENLTTAADKETCLQQIEYNNKIKDSIASSTRYVIGPVTFYYIDSELQPADNGKSLLTIHFVVNDNSTQEITMSCPNQDSCDYSLSDGQKEIPYATNTLVYGSLTLTPNAPIFVDWTFYDVFDTSKNYLFFVKEPWGTGSIPLKIQ